MTSEEIRARIAELEAEAENRAQVDFARRRAAASPATGAEDDPWDALFDAALLGNRPRDSDDFSLSGWVAEGLTGLRASLRNMGLNDEFWSHVHGAERELLLAARALIDARLERVDEQGKQPASTGRLQEIDIDF